MRTSVKVAVVQAAPVGFELEQSIEKMAIFTAEAASAGADLVVFPYAKLQIYHHVETPTDSFSTVKLFSPHTLGAMHSTQRLAQESLEVASGSQNTTIQPLAFLHPSLRKCAVLPRKTRCFYMPVSSRRMKMAVARCTALACSSARTARCCPVIARYSPSTSELAIVN
jgi:hypothetical protein